MSKIRQCYFGPQLSFFKKRFMELYNLVEYHDPDQPAIFYGAHESSQFINSHRNYKLIFPCCPTDYPQISNYEKTLFISSEKAVLPDNVIRKSILPRIKDYSDFKPTIIGDKIYYYSGFTNGWNLKNDIIGEIQKRIDFEIITTNHNNVDDYFSFEYLKNDFYEKCFLNLNFTQGSGISTVIEFGLMGVKTIFNNPHPNNIQRLELPNFITYQNIDDIIRIISDESKKIGTVQEQIDAHNVGDEWINLDYWL
jgi:hypothetical protein